MNHTEIINSIIKKLNYTSYCEIGVSIPKNNFDLIKCKSKVGVDPEPSAKATYQLTSDDYFTNHAKEVDIYFLDGLHHSDQLERDIINASKNLSKNGCIVIHDLNPTEEIQTLVPRQNKQWTGDCYRVMVGFRQKYPNVKSYTYPQDWGVGVIFPDGEVFEEGFISDVSFQEFMDNKKQLLKLI